ncbi:FAD:protein FMN transferase [Actinocrinis puniceicyclus]|uniref:FAD:protein FMN transferase n=1 Tax=Actinocrinis puniceicyclus TaxID=977794 RepID=A0A8J7WRK2_9ACTN|nr:FAD:protein FMN transferase [Actinocrinis puniceicyclus]MBS2966213.1 FAD:protein FMN transferase [Actinocrinis puniceicyclus]
MNPGRAAFPALGGTAVVLAADPARLDAACAAARAEIEAVDLACSRFRSDSELSRVNADAGRPVPVGELFAEALETALRAARLTDGLVDPTCGAALAAAGYDRDFELLRCAGTDIGVLRPAPAPGWRSVSWDASRAVVRTEPGTALDFGATAKALGADRAARAAHRAADCGVLVSLSGDLAVQGPSPDGGWRVRIADDHRDGPDATGTPDDERGPLVTVAEGGLATSSTTVRRWSVGEVQMHHILDPLTGRCAQSCWRTVSVAAISCVDANIAATAAIVRGEPAARWLAGLGLPARLVRNDGSVLTLAGWPAEPDAKQGSAPNRPIVPSPPV